MHQVVTYLELTTLAELRPGPPVPGLALAPVDDNAPVLRAMAARVGAAHHWPTARETEQEWRARTAANPALSHRLVTIDEEPAGITAFETQPAATVEIVTFGLAPEFVGRGFGAAALTETVRHAWTLDPPGAPPVQRVWLHTSSLDHPHALANYRRRGFRPFRRETRD